MKIRSLSVRNAFGYLTLDLKFNKELTFLVGINGSGKTTALKLLEALLTPSLEQLDKIPHEHALIRLEVDGKIVRVESSVKAGVTTVKAPSLGAEGILTYEIPDYLGRDPAAKEAIASAYTSLNSLHASNPVLLFLKRKIDTPLFLGLERRNVAMHFWQAGGTEAGVDRLIAHRRNIVVDSVRRRMPAITGMLGSSLIDVQIVIQEIYRLRRTEQEKFAAQLREQILLDAFEYQPQAIFMRSVRQDVKFIKTILAKRSHVESALKDAGLAETKFRPLVERFYQHMNDLGEKSKSDPDRSGNEAIIELALNKPVVDRVLKLIDSSEKYNKETERLWGPITQFTKLVNRFLEDSGKKLEIDEVGWLYVRVEGDVQPRSLDVLSSGERQLVVIFGHLAINREINRSGIFVVDEPEISLHMKWQEIFVDSILEASPNNQFILATHSPAIVVERDDRCISLV